MVTDDPCVWGFDEFQVVGGNRTHEVDIKCDPVSSCPFLLFPCSVVKVFLDLVIGSYKSFLVSCCQPRGLRHLCEVVFPLIAGPN